MFAFDVSEIISFLSKELSPPTNVTVAFDTMRTRDLKRYLLKLGAESLEIDKLLLREELIALAIQLSFTEQMDRYNEYQIRVAYYLTIFLGVLVFAFAIKDIFYTFMTGFLSFFGSEIFQVQLKLKTVGLCIKKGRFLALAGLILSVICDCIINWVQLSILASWVLPNQSFLRKFMINTLSLPMSPHQLLGIGESNFALDMGPMITLAALRWLSRQFEAIVGQQLIDIVDKKYARRQARMAAFQSNDSYARNNTFFEDNSIFNRKRNNDAEEDLEEVKSKFFAKSPQRKNLQEVDTFADHLPDFLSTDDNSSSSKQRTASILEERDENSILEDASADGSSEYCIYCDALVKKSRMEQHKMYWCPNTVMTEQNDINQSVD